MVQSEIYEEKGQIILDSVSLTNNDGEGDTIDDAPMTVDEMEEYKKSNFVKAMVQGKSTTYGYNFTLYTIIRKK